MKLIRLFVGFVVVSLILGIGSAFNGQSASQITENDNGEISEKVDLPELTSVEESTNDVISQPSEKKEVQETKKTNISANKSKEQKQDINNSSTNQKIQQEPKTDNQLKNNSNPNETPKSVDNSKVIETPKEEKYEDPANNDEQFNAMYYSITHGNAEYSTLAECNSIGYKVKDNELNEILDWNENNSDNLKQPIIKAHWCYEVMKNGRINYFLHFITETGVNMDNELKRKYK